MSKMNHITVYPTNKKSEATIKREYKERVEALRRSNNNRLNTLADTADLFKKLGMQSLENETIQYMQKSKKIFLKNKQKMKQERDTALSELKKALNNLQGTAKKASQAQNQGINVKFTKVSALKSNNSQLNPHLLAGFATTNVRWRLALGGGGLLSPMMADMAMGLNDADLYYIQDWIYSTRWSTSAFQNQNDVGEATLLMDQFAGLTRYSEILGTDKKGNIVVTGLEFKDANGNPIQYMYGSGWVGGAPTSNTTDDILALFAVYKIFRNKYNPVEALERLGKSNIDTVVQTKVASFYTFNKQDLVDLYNNSGKLLNRTTRQQIKSYMRTKGVKLK